MSSKTLPSGRFVASTDALLPLLGVPSHQLQAVLDPSTPMQTIADPCGLGSETAASPIRIRGKKPSITRRLNDALARAAEAILH